MPCYGHALLLCYGEATDASGQERKGSCQKYVGHAWEQWEEGLWLNNNSGPHLCYCEVDGSETVKVVGSLRFHLCATEQ